MLHGICEDNRMFHIGIMGNTLMELGEEIATEPRATLLFRLEAELGLWEG